MGPNDFVYKNIKKILENEGYSNRIASAAAHAGVDEYNNRVQATRRGRIFDDCLREAREYAKERSKSIRY
ncbi:hypothetical protein [Gilliamella sp. wkB308]|uniref:hypothetical protein n=1 Tax=Gilliamella sp. wkB308 TaxID=3120263 RepID=UPI00080EDDB1|nr:hypothetical protein [Gilliamella apicola]OCF98769.1 hypothetical protein A9G10_05965 [Gilliamella apicola]